MVEYLGGAHFYLNREAHALKKGGPLLPFTFSSPIAPFLGTSCIVCDLNRNSDPLTSVRLSLPLPFFDNILSL